MSGGAYDYVSFKIADIRLENITTDPRRAAFQRLLKLVSEAMHDIEWVDSGDNGPGDEHDSIDACMAFLADSPEIIVKAAAYDALKEQLKKYLEV